MQTATVTPERVASLRNAWQDLKTKKTIRIRDAASFLGVSEAELLSCNCGGNVTRLTGDFRQLLKRVTALGRTMALTRNESCVHERKGVYEDISWSGHVGLVLGPDIDLRLFFSHWKKGYAVTEDNPRGTMRSLQLFDASGAAVHKIYLQEGSDLACYEQLIAAYRAPDQSPGETVKAPAAKVAVRPDNEIDVAGMRRAWSAMEDTHEFFGLLRKFKATRTQALRLVGNDFAHPAPLSGVRTLLETVSHSGLPIMIFVGNLGCIQIHTGPVANIRIIDNWVNVMDPEFNLHLREDHIKQAWIVRKPTADGIVTSLEIFDAAGASIAMLFGKRKPGVPEMTEWQDTIARLFPRPVKA
jgi:putative hemin transport protein